MTTAAKQPKAEKQSLNLIEIFCSDNVTRQLLEQDEEITGNEQMQKSLLEKLVSHGITGNVILLIDREYARVSNSSSFDLFVYHVPEGARTAEDITLVIKKHNLMAKPEATINSIEEGYTRLGKKAETVIYVGPLKTETASALGNSYKINFRCMAYNPEKRTALAIREREDITQLLGKLGTASKKKHESRISNGITQAMLPPGVYGISYFAALLGADEKEAYGLALTHEIGKDDGNIKGWTITEEELTQLFPYQVRRKTDSIIELWTKDGKNRVLTEYQIAKRLGKDVEDVRSWLARTDDVPKVMTLVKNGYRLSGTFEDALSAYQK